MNHHRLTEYETHNFSFLSNLSYFFQEKLWSILNSQSIFHQPKQPLTIDEYKRLTYLRCKELTRLNLLTDDELYENPRRKIILEQCLAMYDSSCHAKYSLHTTVFCETIRKLGTQRHAYLLDLEKNEMVRRKSSWKCARKMFSNRFLDVLP